MSEDLSVPFLEQEKGKKEEEPKGKCNKCLYTCTRNHLSTCYVLFILFCILMEIILVSHTTIGITRFAFSEEPCENETHTQKALKGKFSHPSHIKYYRFSQVLYCGICMLHWFEYAYLFYGIFCFFYRTNKNDQYVGITYDICPMLWEPQQHSTTEKNGQQDDNVCTIPKEILKTAVQPFLIVCFFVGFLAISVTPPAIDIKLFHNQASDSECDPRYIRTSYSHQGLTIFSHFVTVLVRFTFVIAATMCGTIWMKSGNVEFEKAKESTFIKADKVGANGHVVGIIASYPGPSVREKEGRGLGTRLVAGIDPGRERIKVAKKNDSEDADAAIKYLVKRCIDEEAAANRYAAIMDDYKEKGKKVKPIYKIYQSWFVFQWIHYIYRLSNDLVYLLRPWFWKEKLPAHHLELFLARNIIVCIYDILVILTSYLPALKMNSYLRHYIRKQQKAQEDAAKNKIYQRTLAEIQYKIKMIKKSSFMPRIPGFGGGMPLEGPGFLIGTVIIIVGSVATFSL